MEKERLLDACAEAAPLKPARRLLFYVVPVCLLLVCCSALPRLVVLDDPLTPEEHINLGVSYEKRGEFDAALKEYEAAAKKTPLAYLYVGNVYAQNNDVSRAEKAYRKAIDKTQSPEAYNNLAWLYYTNNMKIDEAAGLARKAVDLSPGSETFRDTLARIEKRIGK